MRKFVIPIVAVLFILGCGHKEKPVVAEDDKKYYPLNSYIAQKYNLEKSDLLQLQYYTSHDIILHRVVSNSNSEVLDGELIVDKSSNKNKIIIKANTPCVAVDFDSNYVVVNFENGYELTFMNPGEKCCGKKDLYFLSAKEWNENTGHLMIGSQMYQAVGTSGQSHLMISKKSLDEQIVNTITLKGKLITKSED